MQSKYFLFSLFILGISARVPFANAQTPMRNSSLATINNRAIAESLSIAREEITVPTGKGETIEDIVIRFVDDEGNLIKGKTKPYIIKQEFALQPGDAYDETLAQSGLAAVNELEIIERASLTLEPVKENEVNMVVTVEETSSFFFTLSATSLHPTALQGTAKPVTVDPSSNKGSGIAPGFRLGVTNIDGQNQEIILGAEVGNEVVGLNFNYRNYLRHDRGYAVNFFNRRSLEPEFDGGDTDVDLIGGDDPWVHRLGGGVEYFLPLARDFESAVGLTYQLVSVRDDIISDELRSEDELGNTLTFSDDGQDGLLTLSFATSLDRRNETRNPTQGYRLLLQSDQSIPVGDASIFYNRLSANYTHFLPWDLFKFTEGQPALVFNLQAGTIIGDLPGYEAFSLGGAKSVRGYGRGDMGTGRSFVQASGEYRFPIISFEREKEDLEIGGTLFFDYGTDLGSGDTVRGEPAVVRDKPGDGFGYGIGLRSLTPFGIIRLQFALNDEGDSEIIFGFGDRY